MGLRFYGEFTDDQGDDWRINIYDDDYSSASSEVTLGAEGFVLSYDGNQDDMFQRIITSKVNFSAYERSSTAFETWITTDIVQRSESEVKVTIVRDPDGDDALYWAGVMLVDQVVIPDDYDSMIKITASDGLALLKRDQSSGTYNSPLNTLLATLIAKLPTAEFWSTGSGFLRYVNDYYSLGYTGTDFLDDAYVNTPLNHDDLGINGQPQEYNTYDKIEGLLSAFNMRLFQAEGHWYALPLTYYERIADAESPSSLFRQVDKAGTTVALTFFESQYLNNNKIYDDGTDGTRLAGGTTEHLTAKKQIRITRTSQNQDFLYRSQSGQVEFDDTATQASTTNGLLYPEQTTFRIEGFGSFFRYPDSDIIGDAALVTMRLIMTLQVGDQYYNGTSWQGTSANFSVDLQDFLRDSGTVSFLAPINIETAPLTSEEDSLVFSGVFEFIDGLGANVSDEMTNGLLGHQIILRLGNESAITDFTYAAETAEENFDDIDLSSTMFGSFSPNSAFAGLNGTIGYDGGRPTAYQGYTWSGSVLAGSALLTLVTNDALRMAQFPTKVKSNAYHDGIAQLWHTIKQGTEYYVPLTVTINMNARITDVNRFLIDYDGANITDDEGGTGGDTTVPIGGLTDSGGAVDSVNGQTGTVVLDGDDIAYDGSSSVNDLIDANTGNINVLKSYVVSDTDKIDLREDANNKVTVDGTSTLEAITLTVDGSDVFKVNDSEAILTVATEAPTLEANTFAGGLILTDSTGTRWRVQVQTDGTLRTTSL